MHCEMLLRLSIEEVNFTSVRKTNTAQSVLPAKQLQWTTVKNWWVTVDPSRMGKILVGVGTVNWGVEPPTPPPVISTLHTLTPSAECHRKSIMWIKPKTWLSWQRPSRDRKTISGWSSTAVVFQYRNLANTGAADSEITGRTEVRRK